MFTKVAYLGIALVGCGALIYMARHHLRIVPGVKRDMGIIPLRESHPPKASSLSSVAVAGASPTSTHKSSSPGMNRRDIEALLADSETFRNIEYKPAMDPAAAASTIPAGVEMMMACKTNTDPDRGFLIIIRIINDSGKTLSLNNPWDLVSIDILDPVRQNLVALQRWSRPIHGPDPDRRPPRNATRLELYRGTQFETVSHLHLGSNGEEQECSEDIVDLADGESWELVARARAVLKAEDSKRNPIPLSALVEGTYQIMAHVGLVPIQVDGKSVPLQLAMGHSLWIGRVGEK